RSFVRFEGRLLVIVDGDAVGQGAVEHAASGGFGFRVAVVEVDEEPEDVVESDLRVLVVVERFPSRFVTW
ncbi:hypothetical protein, partial [Saccharomonospora viridis]|uniref:hypothetical protein n=1 Tax=Saccharomonospora viridis TaxID=1852 RepID=UPI0023F068BB